MYCIDKKISPLSVGITLLIFRIFFSTVGFLYIGYPILEVFIFIIILLGARIKNYKMSLSIKYRLFWILFVFYTMVTSIFSLEIVGSVKFSLLYLFVVASTITLDSTDGWQKTFIGITIKLSIVFCIATYLLYFFKGAFLNMFSFLYTHAQFDNIKIMLSRGYYSGITNQVGFTGFFISIGIILLYTKFIESRKKIEIFKTFFMFGGLILTAKRGFLIALITVVVFASFLSVKNDKKKIVLKILEVLIGIVIISVIFYNVFEPAKFIVGRFFINGDITSGRKDIYSILIQIFLKKPIIGNGFNFFNRYMSSNYGLAVDGHNIYLQLLAEVGILGIMIFVLAISTTLIRSINSYLTVKDGEKKQYILVSVAIQVFFLLYGFVGNPLYNYQFFMIYMYATSLIFIDIKPLKRGMNIEN